MAEAVPSGSVVYVRYKDHVLYRNQPKPLEDAAERETIGWLGKQNSELICVEHDRTVQDLNLPSGSGNGVLILKRCILELRELPLQRKRNGSLSCQTDKLEGTEYAFQTEKRKTQQPKTRTGAEK